MQTNSDLELALLYKRETPLSKEEYSSFLDFLTFAFEEHYQKIPSKLQYFTFIDSLPLVRYFNKSNYDQTIEKLPPPYIEEYNVEEKALQLDQYWLQQLKIPSPSLLSALRGPYNKHWNIVGIMTSSVFILQLISTLFLGKVLQIVSAHNTGDKIPFSEAIGYVIGFAVIYFIAQFTESYYWYFAYCVGSLAKFSIMALVYKKIICVTLSSLQQINIGKIINLMSNELSEIENSGHSVWQLFLSPFHLLLGFLMVWSDFGVLTLIAVIVQGSLLWLNEYLSEKSKIQRSLKNQISDARIKLTDEMMQSARFIKFYAWEKPLRAIVNNYRFKEVEAYLVLTKVEAISKPLGEITVNLILFSIMLIFSLTGGILNAEKVYFSLTVLNFMKRKVLLPSTTGKIFFVNFKLMQKRIEEILMLQELQKIKEFYSPKKKVVPHSKFINIQDFTATWAKESTCCLKNINSKIPYGQLTSIIGKVASGKTSLLLAFMNEIPVHSGLLEFQGSVAYVEQDPIVFSQSIRENILFGQEYDDNFYKIVIKACCLEEDLKQLDHGDQTIIGERGVTLSGGQRARLSLARALYSQSDIYLLDDPLAAVDSRVARVIFEKALKIVLAGKTVILVTHHLEFAKKSDHLLVLDEGLLICEGSYQKLLEENMTLFKYFTTNEDDFTDLGRRFSNRIPLDFINSEIEEQKVDEEAPAKSTWRTYVNYVKEGQQYGLGFLTLIIYVLCSILLLSFTRIVGIWADAQSQAYAKHESETEFVFDNQPYVMECIILLISITVTFYLKIMLTAQFFLKTNSILHEKMLYKVTRCQVSFLDRTPSGRIINRFSGDLTQLDRRLWQYAFDFLSAFFDWVIFMGYLVFKTFYLVIPTVVAIILLFWIKAYFTKSLISLKNAELQTMSPLYSEISSTIHGLICIRIFRQGAKFIRGFLDKLYNNAKATYHSARISRLFAFGLQLAIYALIISAIFLFVWMVYYRQMDSGLFGMGFYNFILIGLNSVWMIRQTLFIEQAMQSAERILEYCNLEEEPPEEAKLDRELLQENGRFWPNQGLIKFSNVYLRYPEAQQCALSGISFKIQPGTKIGIVGRTGAGKSSILHALFRMVEISNLSSSRIEIDGTNIQQLGIEFLRKNICIIPQTPVILNGTIKTNLDPFGSFKDLEIWEILQEINLAEYIDSLPAKLETEIGSANSVFSAGQKQLICLGRVLLKKSKILVLDEATSNVDIETDDFIQKKIREKFPESTILTTAHRLTTIADYDKVMVLEKGKIVEFDHPYSLLVKKIGDTKITNYPIPGNFVDLVQKNGEEVARRIFELAKKSYDNKIAAPDLEKQKSRHYESPNFRHAKHKESIMRSNSFAPFFGE